MLFLFLAILEDTGYLARAAFLMDRVLSKVGLHGKSFIRCSASFALRDSWDHGDADDREPQGPLSDDLRRALFVSCSASRLPVYTLLIGSFFAGRGALAQAGIMLSPATCWASSAAAANGLDRSSDR